MGKRKGTAKTVPDRAAAACVLCLAVFLLVYSAAMGEGIRKGLSVSAGILIPSLFPFMALSGFISMTRYGKTLSAPFGWITEKCFKLPAELGYVLLLSLIGGYPVGAKVIAGLLERKIITHATAGRMLCFCVNAGPPFLITAVGAGMLGDKKAGLVLFASQLAAALIVGTVFSLKAKRPEIPEESREYSDTATAFVTSVAGAASAIITLCAFAVLFSGLSELILQSGFSERLAGFFSIRPEIPAAFVGGVLEVTAGCLAASRIGGPFGFALVSAFISFGGISVIFQVISLFRGSGVRFTAFLCSRAVHAAISASISTFLYDYVLGYPAKPVWTPANPPQMLAGNGTVVMSLCLIGMCTALLFSLSEAFARPAAPAKTIDKAGR